MPGTNAKILVVFYSRDGSVEALAKAATTSELLRIVLNPLPLAKPAQTDERDLPPILRQYRLSRERNPSKNPRLVSHGELAEAAQLQRKAVRVEIVQ